MMTWHCLHQQHKTSEKPAEKMVFAFILRLFLSTNFPRNSKTSDSLLKNLKPTNLLGHFLTIYQDRSFERSEEEAMLLTVTREKHLADTNQENSDKIVRDCVEAPASQRARARAWVHIRARV